MPSKKAYLNSLVEKLIKKTRFLYQLPVFDVKAA